MITYASSWTQICNRALGRLGAIEISDLSEGSQNASFCNTFLGDAIEEVLGQYDWSCCTKRTRLAPDTVKPEYGYAYRFPLPVDCIRIVQIKPNEPYALESGYILSDTHQLNLIYIERPKNPDTLHPSLRKAIHTTLAFLLTTPLTSSEQLAVRVANEAQQAIERAKIEDAQTTYDQQQSAPQSSWWNEARL
jgi:hypothetical protein